MYGIDWNGPLPVQTSETVAVPHTMQPMSATDYQELCASVDPLGHSDDHGIDIYTQCLCFVQSKLN